jgi:hypothetical protein
LIRKPYRVIPEPGGVLQKECVLVWASARSGVKKQQSTDSLRADNHDVIATDIRDR